MYAVRTCDVQAYRALDGAPSGLGWRLPARRLLPSSGASPGPHVGPDLGPTAAPNNSRPGAWNRKLIRIVEDNEDARFVFSAILDYDGDRIVEAVDGDDAIARGLKHVPDLIITEEIAT